MTHQTHTLVRGKLANITNSVNRVTNVVTYRLVLRISTWDKGLEEWVTDSLNVKIIPDHEGQLPYYEGFRKKDVILPVKISTMQDSNNLFFSTCDQGTFLTDNPALVTK